LARGARGSSRAHLKRDGHRRSGRFLIEKAHQMARLLTGARDRRALTATGVEQQTARAGPHRQISVRRRGFARSAFDCMARYGTKGQGRVGWVPEDPAADLAEHDRHDSTRAEFPFSTSFKKKMGPSTMTAGRRPHDQNSMLSVVCPNEGNTVHQEILSSRAASACAGRGQPWRATIGACTSTTKDSVATSQSS